MATVTKILLRPAIYSAPQGQLRATPARLARWARTFADMMDQDIRVPVAWGHQPEALPGDSQQRATQQYYLSRFNAGYLEQMGVDAEGNLSVRLDCPGCDLDEKGNLTSWVKLPDGRQVRTAIAEVSAAIRDWTDGTGRVWPDSIVHVALTPLPVAHGTGGFKPAGAWNEPVCNDGRRMVTLSLATILTELGTTMPEETTPAENGATEKKDYFKDGMAILAKRGLALPDDTNPENFWERVCVAGHALENAGVPAATPPTTDGDMDFDDMGMETDTETDTGAIGTEGADGEGGVSYSGEDDEDEANEEERPVMMSLSTIKNPFTRKLIQKKQDEHKVRLAKKVDGLVRRGLSEQRARAFREKIDGYTLSLTTEGNLVPKQLDVLLSSLDEALPPRNPLTSTKTRNGRLKERGRPDLRGEPQESEAEIERRAAEVSVTGSAKR